MEKVTASGAEKIQGKVEILKVEILLNRRNSNLEKRM